jgi:predicted CXXCH cytochrome family protein
MATEPPVEPVEPAAPEPPVEPAQAQQGPPDRRIPPWLGWALTLIVIVFVAFFISLAFKSSKSPAAAGDGEATPEASASGATNAATDFLACTDCHQNLDNVLTNGSQSDKLLNFTHDMHFAKGVSDCANCHPLPAHEPDKINRPTMGRCFVCHGTGETAIAPGNCQTCHPPGSPTVPSTHTQGNWLNDHPESALADPFECATCHDQSFCQNCHGLPVMPHPEGWKGTPHVETFFKTGFPTCQNCHNVGSSPEQDLAQKGPDFCDQCHHQWGPKNVSWIKYHPTVVKNGDAQTCFGCHNPATCATCHVEGTEDLSADKVSYTSAQAAVPSPTAFTSPSPSTAPAG